MTYLRRGCGRCGYSYNTSVYGYVHDPIGPAFCICPRCREIQRDSKSREWIQMSPFRKFWSVHPRSRAIGFFLAIPLYLLLAAPFIALNLPGLSVLGLVLCYPLAVYLLTVLKVNSESFRKRYCDSILRTQNREYRAMLERSGKLYDESIPGWLLCGKGTKAEMARIIQANPYFQFSLPTIPQTIRNA